MRYVESGELNCTVLFMETRIVHLIRQASQAEVSVLSCIVDGKLGLAVAVAASYELLKQRKRNTAS